MASVQYLFTCARQFSKELVTAQKHFTLITNYRLNYVILIQTAWRRYIACKRYQHIRKCIITIQSYCRGWRVRKNRKQYEKEHVQDMCDSKRKKAAIKIQSWWRGSIERKFMKDRLPRKRIAERKRIYMVNTEMAATMRELIEENTTKQQQTIESENQQEALYILYKCHHLLRTYANEGIYSCHDSKELSIIEQLLKSLPCKDYMDGLRKLYYELQNVKKTHKYKFKKKSLRNLEDDMLAYNLLRGKSKVNVLQDYANHDKPFKLTAKLKEKSYVTSIDCGDGRYKTRAKPPRNQRLDYLERHFDLSLRKTWKPLEKPYYIDYWEKEIFGKSNHENNHC